MVSSVCEQLLVLVGCCRWCCSERLSASELMRCCGVAVAVRCEKSSGSESWCGAVAVAACRPQQHRGSGLSSSTPLSTESIHRDPGVVDTAADSTVETAGSPWSSTPPRATLNTRCGTPRLSSSTPLERLLSSGSTATLSVPTQSDRLVSTLPGVIVLLAGCCRQ